MSCSDKKPVSPVSGARLFYCLCVPPCKSSPQRAYSLSGSSHTTVCRLLLCKDIVNTQYRTFEPRKIILYNTTRANIDPSTAPIRLTLHDPPSQSKPTVLSGDSFEHFPGTARQPTTNPFLPRVIRL